MVHRYDLDEDVSVVDADANTVLDLLAIPDDAAPLFVYLDNFDSLAGRSANGAEALKEFSKNSEEACYSKILGAVLLVSELADSPPSDPGELGLCRTLDLTHHPAFQTAVGFTDDEELTKLDEAFKLAQLLSASPEVRGPSSRIRIGHYFD
ncbi:hypothetical protein HMN09_00394900 [Mycena chlorophos]|uniref:Uncharacterized protein n=1 Tax=Mycena chlorophos TaxID=658473 RepID=A0A8H6WIY9_MYCCL|nr:hypothetical protein HMN09_00394900 [Mycena chlorophos]